MRAPLLAVLALLLALPLAAQGAPALGEVRRMVQADRYADARAALARWWERAGEGAAPTERASALFLRAVLSDSLPAAERDLLRVVVEHPLAPEADDALLRLAHARLVQGDTAGAAAHLERLERDYPQSPLRPAARELRGRVAPEPARRVPAPARTVEVDPPGCLPDAPCTLDRYTVEVAAEPSVARAAALRDALRARGFDAFLVMTGADGAVHVRVGRFRDRASASGVMERLRGAGYSPRVVEIDG